MVVSIIAVIATSFTSFFSAAEVNAILPSLIIAGPIYLAEVGGMVYLKIVCARLEVFSVVAGIHDGEILLVRRRKT